MHLIWYAQAACFSMGVVVFFLLSLSASLQHLSNRISSCALNCIILRIASFLQVDFVQGPCQISKLTGFTRKFIKKVCQALGCGPTNAPLFDVESTVPGIALLKPKASDGEWLSFSFAGPAHKQDLGPSGRECDRGRGMTTWLTFQMAALKRAATEKAANVGGGSADG